MKPRPGLLATLALIAAPLASRLALAFHHPRPAVLLLTSLQVAGLACLLLQRRGRGAATCRLWLLPAAALWLAAQRTPTALVLLADAALAHAILQLCLLTLFAPTLRRGREPLVTQLARRVHGPLRADIARFTRRVTQAWCLFFTAELLLSGLLLALAPVRWWWRLVPDLCLPLTGLMFVAEYLVRRWRITGIEHVRFTAAIDAFRDRAGPAR